MVNPWEGTKSCFFRKFLFRLVEFHARFSYLVNKIYSSNICHQIWRFLPFKIHSETLSCQLLWTLLLTSRNSSAQLKFPHRSFSVCSFLVVFLTAPAESADLALSQEGFTCFLFFPASAISRKGWFRSAVRGRGGNSETEKGRPVKKKTEEKAAPPNAS